MQTECIELLQLQTSLYLVDSLADKTFRRKLKPCDEMFYRLDANYYTETKHQSLNGVCGHRKSINDKIAFPFRVV